MRLLSFVGPPPLPLPLPREPKAAAVTEDEKVWKGLLPLPPRLQFRRRRAIHFKGRRKKEVSEVPNQPTRLLILVFGRPLPPLPHAAATHLRRGTEKTRKELFPKVVCSRTSSSSSSSFCTYVPPPKNIYLWEGILFSRPRM